MTQGNNTCGNAEQNKTSLSTSTSTKIINSNTTTPLPSTDNPIQLAAISNYKLAQLTFSPPDATTMRRTALIKNMSEAIYNNTPPEWLDQMRRWEFFTPESLNDMTQGSLEQIFNQYIQTMEAFQPIQLVDDDEEDFWADEEILTPNENQLDLTTVNNIGNSIYSNKDASLSVDIFYNKESKPLPEKPKNIINTTVIQDDCQRQKAIATIRSRLSWTSDTGLSSNSAVAQTWANELMTMFDMDFQVDTSLSLSTAPRLPELPFTSRHNKNNRRSRKSLRYSSDSFMNLIPAFESFSLDDIETRTSIGNRPRNLTMTSPTSSSAFNPTRRRSSSTPSPFENNIIYDKHARPIRSSSLKYKQSLQQQQVPIKIDELPKHKSHDLLNGIVNVFSGVKVEKSLSKKKSIRRLRALVTGQNNHSNSSSQHNKQSNNNSINNNNHNNSNKKKHSSSSSTQLYKSSPLQSSLSIKKHKDTGSSASVSSISSNNSYNTNNNISTTSTHYTNTNQSNNTNLSNNTNNTNNNNNINKRNSKNKNRDSDTSNKHISTCSTSNLSLVSTSTNNSSSNSLIMVATKTPVLQHKPLPSKPVDSNHIDNNVTDSTKRRTSYTMARPVVVEVSNLRRSRSLDSRSKKGKKLGSSKSTSTAVKKSKSVNSTKSRKSDPTIPSVTIQVEDPIIMMESPIEYSSSTSTSSSSSPQTPPPLPKSSSFSSYLAPPHSNNNLKPSDITSSTSLNEQLLGSNHDHHHSSHSSTLLPPPQPKRSKSALIKLSSGLTKSHKSSKKNHSSPPLPTASYSTSVPYLHNDTVETTFVKKISSFGKKMKLQKV